MKRQKDVRKPTSIEDLRVGSLRCFEQPGCQVLSQTASVDRRNDAVLKTKDENTKY